MKRCYKCGESKPPEMFSKDKSRADGLQPRCKACYSAYKSTLPKAPRLLLTEEEKALRRKVYRSANRKKHTEQAAEWRKLNPEKVIESITKYRATNGENSRAVRKAWSEENKDRIREQNRQYRASNSGMYAEYCQRRNARKLRATPSWANTEAMRAFYALAAEMTKTTGVTHHVDHVVPLQSKLVCGLHCEFNMQVLIGSENSSKGNRHWPDMP